MWTRTKTSKDLVDPMDLTNGVGVVPIAVETRRALSLGSASCVSFFVYLLLIDTDIRIGAGRSQWKTRGPGVREWTAASKQAARQGVWLADGIDAGLDGRLERRLPVEL